MPGPVVALTPDTADRVRELIRGAGDGPGVETGRGRFNRPADVAVVRRGDLAYAPNLPFNYAEQPVYEGMILDVPGLVSTHTEAGTELVYLVDLGEGDVSDGDHFAVRAGELSDGRPLYWCDGCCGDWADYFTRYSGGLQAFYLASLTSAQTGFGYAAAAAELVLHSTLLTIPAGVGTVGITGGVSAFVQLLSYQYSASAGGSWPPAAPGGSALVQVYADVVLLSGPGGTVLGSYTRDQIVSGQVAPAAGSNTYNATGDVVANTPSSDGRGAWYGSSCPIHFEFGRQTVPRHFAWRLRAAVTAFVGDLGSFSGYFTNRPGGAPSVGWLRAFPLCCPAYPPLPPLTPAPPAPRVGPAFAPRAAGTSEETGGAPGVGEPRRRLSVVPSTGIGPSAPSSGEA